MESLNLGITKSMIYKKCPISSCHTLFPTHLFNINSYCSKHQTEFKSFLEKCIKKRMIPIDTLNIYNKKGEPLCRSCGELLRAKEENCVNPNCNNLAQDFPSHYSHKGVAKRYIADHAEGDNCKCEKCGRICCVDYDHSDSKKKLLKIEIHHKREVFRTSFETWEDVWDPNNLIALCHNCHSRSNRYTVMRSIDLSKYVFHPELKADIKNLSSDEQTSIKNIEEYLINRYQRSKNWKTQQHFSSAVEIISTRVSEREFKQIKQIDTNTYIRNFIRIFLTDPEFRKNFIILMHDQVTIDATNITVSKLCPSDKTDYYQIMKDLYPMVISCKINNIEKEMLFFYFGLVLRQFTISYALRTALLHEFKIEDQAEFEILDIRHIMKNLCDG